MKTAIRYSTSFIAPVVMTLVLPYLIIWQEHGSPIPRAQSSVWLLVPGLALTIAGFALAITTFRMFILIGKGTIMPWDPTRRLITGSLYGYVRNPMILSLIVVQAGEAILFASYMLAALAAFFFILNTVYFRFMEEPGLVERFGAEYVEYRKHVPMWLPRFKAWHPE